MESSWFNMAKGRKTGGRKETPLASMLKVVDSLSKGASIVSACRAARVDRGAFYDWKNKTPENTKKVNDVLDQRSQVVEDALYKAAMGGNITAQIFFLKNRASARWSDTQDVNHKHTMSFTDFIGNEDDDKPKK